MRKLIILIFIILTCLSCGVVDFSPSDSIRVNPSKYNQVVGENEDIYVKFGFSPEHVSAQSAFDIQDSDGRVAGSFDWKENTMTFTPRKVLNRRKGTSSNMQERFLIHQERCANIIFIPLSSTGQNRL